MNKEVGITPEKECSDHHRQLTLLGWCKCSQELSPHKYLGGKLLKAKKGASIRVNQLVQTLQAKRNLRAWSPEECAVWGIGMGHFSVSFGKPHSLQAFKKIYSMGLYRCPKRLSALPCLLG